MKKILFMLVLAIGLCGGQTIAQKRHDGHRGHSACEERSRHHRSPYFITDNKVFFEGRMVEGASASSFSILRDGYAKDSWNVYYDGKKIAGASPDNFKVLRDGYAKDAWNVYFDAVKIEGASPDSFKVLRDGYASDSWNTYYFGRKID